MRWITMRPWSTFWCPDMDGIAFLEAKRLCPLLHVILISGHPEAEQKAQGAGAFALVSKPIERDKFIRVLFSAVAHHRGVVMAEESSSFRAKPHSYAY